MAAPPVGPTYVGTSQRPAAEIAVCYSELFSRQRGLKIGTTKDENAIILRFGTGFPLMNGREGSIRINDQGSERRVEMFFPRLKSQSGVPAHLASCLR